MWVSVSSEKAHAGSADVAVISVPAESSSTDAMNGAIDANDDDDDDDDGAVVIGGEGIGVADRVGLDVGPI